MADKNELDDINDLLAGLDNDLVSPPASAAPAAQGPEEQQETKEPVPPPTPLAAPVPPTPPPAQTNPQDDKIQDLLSGLDDAFFVGDSAAAPPPPPPAQPASPQEDSFDNAPPSLAEDSPLAGLDDMISSPIEDSPVEEPPPSAPLSDPIPESSPQEPIPSEGLSDLSLDLPSPEELDIEFPSSPPSPGEPDPAEIAPAEPPPPLAETEIEPDKKKSGRFGAKKSTDLSEKQLQFIQMRVSHFGPQLREAVGRIIVEEKIDKDDIAALLQLILQKKSVQQIRDFVQEKTGSAITGPLLDETYSRKLKAKKKASARRQKFQASRQSPWELFLESVLPALRPLLIFAGFVALLAFVVYPPVRSSHLIRQGEKLIDARTQEKQEEAEKNFLKALKIRPRFFDAYIRYADAYTRNENPAQAGEKLAEYKGLRGENFEWLMAMARLLRSQNRLEPAADHFNRARHSRPSSFEALDGAANIDFLSGRVDKSLSLYAAYVRKYPRHIHAQFRILEILISRDDMLGSQQKFNEILRLRNRHLSPDITTRFAQYYIDKSIGYNRDPSQAHVVLDYRAKAHNILNRVLKQHPRHAPAYFQAARLSLLRRNLYSAQRAIESAIRHDKNRPEYYTLHGVISLRRDLPEKALAAFASAIGADPQYLPAHYQRARLIYETQEKNTTAARNHYQKVYDLLPTTPAEHRVEVDEEELHYRLAWLAYNASDFEEAIRMWTLFFRHNPDNPAVNLGRGTAHYNMGNYAMSVKDLEAAVSSYRVLTSRKKIIEPNKAFDQELYHNLSASLNNLGIAYYRAGNQRQALLNLYQSVEAIKTVGFFNEREEANINIHNVLRPTRDTASRLVTVENIPRFHVLPE